MEKFISKKDVPKNYTGVCRIFERSETQHYLNGRLHRENGPAVINDDGSTAWMWKGMLHRDDGPAIIIQSIYSQNGQPVVRTTKEFYFKGKAFKTEEEYLSDTKVKKAYMSRMLLSINEL